MRIAKKSSVWMYVGLPRPKGKGHCCKQHPVTLRHVLPVSGACETRFRNSIPPLSFSIYKMSSELSTERGSFRAEIRNHKFTYNIIVHALKTC